MYARNPYDAERAQEASEETYSCFLDGVREELEAFTVEKLEEVARGLGKQHGWAEYVDEWIAEDNVPPTKQDWIGLILESGSVMDVDRYLHPDTYAKKIDPDGFPFYAPKVMPSLKSTKKES